MYLTVSTISTYIYNVSMIDVKACHCERCGHTWLPENGTPVRCARCKTPYWNVAPSEHRKRGRPAVSKTLLRESPPSGPIVINNPLQAAEAVSRYRPLAHEERRAIPKPKRSR